MAKPPRISAISHPETRFIKPRLRPDDLGGGTTG